MIWYGGRLSQQYVVDNYVKIETHRESYALHNEDDPDFTKLAKFDYPFHVPFLQSPNGIYRVVGTCNGLFCLSDDKLSYS